MIARKLSDNIVMIDRELGGYQGFIATYCIRGESGWIVVDPGPRRDVEQILSVCPDISAIIVTHIHIDHAGGGATLQMVSKTKIYVHPRGVKHLIDPSALWDASRRILMDAAEYYMRPEPADPRLTEPLDEGFLKVDGVELEVMYTPGHASHHLSLIHGDDMFPGDAAGLYLCGHQAPTTPPRYELGMALASIDKMISRSPKRLFLPHFGLIKDGVGFLRSYSRLLTRLAELVSKCMSKGLSFEETYRVVKEEGPLASYIRCMERRGPPYMRESPNRSILGIYDYLRRKGGGGRFLR